MANLTRTGTGRDLSTTLAIAFFILSAVILIIIGGLSLLTNLRTSEAAIESRQQLIAQDAAKSVTNYVEEKFSRLETAMEFANPVTTGSAESTTIVQTLLGLDPAFRQFAVIDSSGRRLGEVSRLSPLLSPQFVSQLAGPATAPISRDQRFISAVYIDETTSEPMVALGIPVKNPLGDYIGTLLAELSIKYMWDLVDQLEVGETGYAYVVDRQGNLIAFRDTGRVLRSENLSSLAAVAEYTAAPLTEGATGVSAYTGVNGEDVIGAYAVLGSPDWAVVVELPASEAYRSVVQVSALSVGIILALAVLAALASSVLVRRMMVPLVNLTETATRIAAGESGLRAKLGGARELSSLAAAFNSMTAQLGELIDTLEQRVASRTADLEQARQQSERRAREMRTIGEISNVIASEQQIENLLPLITRLVSERFDFYHVGIFLVEETGQFAVLRAANSEGGQRMLERSHRLEVGQTGIVGFVAHAGVPRIALDVGTDSVFFNSPDLPATRSEMALPLRSRGQIIGVLDVQSTKAGAFAQSDADSLAVLADQVAIAIDNARLFGETQQALGEVQALYAQYLTQEWGAFAQKGGRIGYHRSLVDGRELSTPVESSEIRQAVNTGQVVVLDPEDTKADAAIVMPIKLRGKVIGVINIKTPSKGRSWSDDEVNMVRVISERLALALENARLFEETTRTAEREKLVSDITTSIRSTNDPQTMIEMAVAELRRALGVSRVEIIPQRVSSASPEL